MMKSLFLFFRFVCTGFQSDYETRLQSSNANSTKSNELKVFITKYFNDFLGDSDDSEKQRRRGHGANG